jgi:lipoyl(octanoyl) transferase
MQGRFLVPRLVPTLIRLQSTTAPECVKFHPHVPSAETLRHLHFKIPLDYAKGQLIQEQFKDAFIQFKKLSTKIKRKQQELYEQNLTTNDYETELLKNILHMKPSPTLLSFEFKPVFTAGRREKGKLDGSSINRLQSYKDYEFIQTNRGGEISFHNPGQIVIYPILDLQDFHKLTIKCFVSKLEDSIISALKHFNVDGIKTENTGVWIDENTKISSIGLNVSRSITSHGISINVANEIPKIEQLGFNFCGLDNKAQTNMSLQSGKTVQPKEVATEFARSFAKNLGITQIESIELEDLDLV